MTTYTQTKATLDEIAQRSEANRKRIEQAKSLIDTAVSDLTAMEGAYGQFVSDLTADANANPGDEAWQTANAEMGQMLGDFQALKGRAIALQAAVEE